jgi:hypothetical protein
VQHPREVRLFALWAGIPLWPVARHLDTGPQAAQLPAIAYLPARQDDPATSALPNPRRGRVREQLGPLIVNRRRLLGGADLLSDRPRAKGNRT